MWGFGGISAHGETGRKPAKCALFMGAKQDFPRCVGRQLARRRAARLVARSAAGGYPPPGTPFTFLLRSKHQQYRFLFLPRQRFRRVVRHRRAVGRRKHCRHCNLERLVFAIRRSTASMYSSSVTSSLNVSCWLYDFRLIRPCCPHFCSDGRLGVCECPAQSLKRPAPSHIRPADCGRAQCWEGPIEEVRPGDVICFAPGEKQWHGAAPTTAMTHIAIQEQLNGKAVDWMETNNTESEYLHKPSGAEAFCIPR